MNKVAAMVLVATAPIDPDLTLQRLENTQYAIEGQTIQFTNGSATLQPTGTAQLDQQQVAFGDLNGDGLTDAGARLFPASSEGLIAIRPIPPGGPEGPSRRDSPR